MRIAWCLLAVAGCTTVDDGLVVEVDARDAPVVVLQDGDGPWERVETTADGHASVQIHAATYGLGALCGDAAWKTSTFIFDSRPQNIFLACPRTSAHSTALRVTGSTEPLATVWLGGESVRADDNGHFDLPLFEPGLHDVFAILPTTPPKIVARRAIAISGDTTVDLPAGDAVELEALFPTVLGDATGIQLSSDLDTATDWLSLGQGSSMVFVPPPSVLVATDRPAIAASTGNTQPPSSSCTRQHPLSAANTPFELPAPLAYTIDRTRLAWTADPAIAWDSASIELSSATGAYTAFASASWRELGGTSSIPIVDLASLPGWTDDLARIEPDEPATAAFALSRGVYDGDYTSCTVFSQIDRW